MKTDTKTPPPVAPVPNPGSWSARTAGCRCDGPTNEWGRGTETMSGLRHYTIAPDCPLHTERRLPGRAA